MNVKKNTMSITLAFVMITLIFAVTAPATIAQDEPLRSPAGFEVNKESVPDPDAAYRVGNTINYSIRLANSYSSFNATVQVWDILPNNTKLEWRGNASVEFPVGGAPEWWNYTTTVMADWDTTPNPWNIPGNDKFTNVVFVSGRDDNPNFPGGDTIEAFVQFSSPLIVERPEFDFDWEPACCYNISFSGTADKEVVNYTWDFGDGDTESYEEDLPGTTSHVYAACGEYTVTLSGWSEDGEFVYNETQKDIYVDCGPQQVTAWAEPECYEQDGTEITFRATAMIDTLPIKKWEWTFSDDTGTTYDGQEVTRMVTEDITATVEVWVGLDDDTLCCSDTDTVEVERCPSEVPVLLPIGLIALVGLLTVIATSTILRKKK